MSGLGPFSNGVYKRQCTDYVTRETSVKVQSWTSDNITDNYTSKTSVDAQSLIFHVMIVKATVCNLTSKSQVSNYPSKPIITYNETVCSVCKTNENSSHQLCMNKSVSDRVHKRDWILDRQPLSNIIMLHIHFSFQQPISRVGRTLKFLN